MVLRDSDLPCARMRRFAIASMLTLTVLAIVVLLPPAGAEGLPEVTFVSTGGHVSGEHVLEVTVTGDLEPGEVYYGLDGDPDTIMTDVGGGSFSTTIDSTALADGPHTLFVKAVNTTGESVTVTQDVAVDNHSPVVSMVFQGGLVGGDLLVSGTAEDPYLNESAVYCMVDNDMEAALDHAMTRVGDHFELLLDTTALDDGAHDMRILAYDQWGNSNKSQGVGLEVDNTYVQIQILSDSGVYSGTYTARARIFDENLNESSVMIRVVGHDPVPMVLTDEANVYECVLDISGLPEGENSLMIEARDLVGAVSDSTFKITVINVPNLQVHNVSWDRVSLDQGEVLTASVTIRNDGSADASGFKVAMVKGTEVLASVEVTETLAGGQSKVLEVEWTSEGEGTVSLTIQVDPEDQVTEADETDNVWGIATDITVKRPEEDGEEESPGPGAVMAMVGLLVAAACIRRRS